MSVLTRSYTMSNGVTIPKVGFGTWQMPDNARTQRAVEDALAIGYRHIDTAYVYGNERSVGRALRASGLKREEVFVTSKLANSIKNHKDAARALDRSLENLGLDYLDLYLIHAPWSWMPDESDDAGNLAAWNAMEEGLEVGKIRAIGVSNFDAHDMSNLIDHADIAPMVNQILYYVGLTEPDNLAFCTQHDILVEAYSPLATGYLLNHPDLRSIADAHGVTPAQVAIRYCLEHNVLPLPKATSREHIRLNAELDFHLTDAEMSRLDALEGAAPGRGMHFPQQH